MPFDVTFLTNIYSKKKRKKTKLISFFYNFKKKKGGNCTRKHPFQKNIHYVKKKGII
jgi:hypothetical protein